MKRVQCSALGKLMAWLVLLAAVFVGGLFGMKALRATPYLGTENYQDTREFYNLLRSERDKVADVFALSQELSGEELTYVERQQRTEQLEQTGQSLDASATNFRFVVRDVDGGVVSSNIQEELLAEQVQAVSYAYFVLGEHYTSSLDESYDEGAEFAPGSTTNSPAPADAVETLETAQDRTIYTIECGVVKEEEMGENGIEDEFFQLSLRYYQMTNSFSDWAAMAAACLAAAAAALLYILWTAGHKEGEEEVVLTWQENIFFDIYFIAMFAAGVGIAALGVYLLERGCSYYLYYQSVYYQEAMESEYGWLSIGVAGLCSLFAAVVGLTLRTLLVRLKSRCLLKTTLTFRVLAWVWRGFCLLGQSCLTLVRSLPFLWKTVAAFVLYFFANVMLFSEARYNGLAGFLWGVVNIGALLVLCWWSIAFRKIQKGSGAIAAGDLNHQIDTHRMPHDLKRHAEALNNISGGLQTAVNEQMKSERFKAELITNVSHDLKTPLTSIINYVDLLKTTQQTDPKAQEYIQVLDRKAQRLKKLTEDLVEASKASTGTLAVNREKIGMVQLVDQALGEYEERLESKKLTVVTTLPEEEAFVYADGRHLWRVMDNLLSNCCKYALEGTRVYLELVRGHGQVVLSVKNISRDALNVPPERLMERFVRGEESRTTEGSGLGLSIARSLTELQGGTFELVVDGDLFKAIVTMPQAG